MYLDLTFHLRKYQYNKHFIRCVYRIVKLLETSISSQICLKRGTTIKKQKKQQNSSLKTNKLVEQNEVF